MSDPVTLAIKRAVRCRDGFRCIQCRLTNDEHKRLHRNRSLDVHRIEPHGPYSLENCVTLCKVCHGAKSSKRGPRITRRRKMGGRFQVSIEPILLARIAMQAERFGMTTAEYIRMACTQQMERDASPAPPSTRRRTPPPADREGRTP